MKPERTQRSGLAPNGPPSGGRVLPFRRSAVKPKRKRRSLALALVQPLLGAVALVGLPVGLATWALTSPRFSLSQLDVVGSERVPAAWVRSALAPLRGRNLILLPLAEVDRALAGHPWVAGFEVSKQLPARLRVTVAQKVPAALVPRDDGPWFADADGHPIAPLAGEDPGGLLLVSTAPGAMAEGEGVPVALAVAAELAVAEPEWAAGMTRVEALSGDEARLFTAALPWPLLVRVGEIAPRAHRLAELMPKLGERYSQLAEVDLRFSRRIVVQPADARAVGSS